MNDEQSFEITSPDGGRKLAPRAVIDAGVADLSSRAPIHRGPREVGDGEMSKGDGVTPASMTAREFPPPLTGRGRSLLRSVFQAAASEYSEEHWCAQWYSGLVGHLRLQPKFLVMAYLCDGWPIVRDGDEPMVWEPLADDEVRRAQLLAFTERNAW